MSTFYTYLIMKLDVVRIACGIGALVLTIIATGLYTWTDVNINLKDPRLVCALIILAGIVILLPSTTEMKYLLTINP